MNLSKIDLLNKKFSRRPMGYSCTEVDALLGELADVLGEAAREKKAAKKQLAQMEERIEEYRQRDATLRDTLMSTQKMVDDIKAGAHKEAKNILEESKAKGQAMIQQAHDRLAQVHEDIETLKRQRTQFEIQLKGLLEAHMRMLESEDPGRDAMEELESKLTFLKKAT